MRRILLLAFLLGGCEFDSSGQEMAEVGGPDAGEAVVDDPTPPAVDAEPAPEPPPPPDAEDEPDEPDDPDWDDDDHHGPGGGDGPGPGH